MAGRSVFYNVNIDKKNNFFVPALESCEKKTILQACFVLYIKIIKITR